MLKKVIFYFEDIIATILFTIMLIAVLLNVFCRYILNAPIMVIDELARYLLIWMTFIGAAAVSKYNEHIRVEIIDRHLNRKMKFVQSSISGCIIIIVALVMVIWGFSLAKSSFIIKSPSLEIRQTFLYIIIPICGIFILIRIYKWLPKMFKNDLTKL